MNKVLSLIVPTYNMERLLPRCLDSVTRADVPGSLQVIVVNDGSRDSSLAIAQSYRDKRPDVVLVVDKPNGNYGSCVNAALPLAEGKFIKMLDADDWYDTDEIIKLLHALQSCDADMFISHYQRRFADGRELKIPVSSHWQFDKLYDVDEVFSTDEFMRLQMHQIGYRTELLRAIGYHQTEGISYTDVEWTYCPLFHVSKVQFVNADVYRYFLGREGQTMQQSVVVKSLAHEAESLVAMLKYCGSQPAVSSPNLLRYLRFRTANRAINIYFNSLIFMTDEQFESFNMPAFDSKLALVGQLEYQAVASYDVRSRLIVRWRNRQRRECGIVRSVIGALWNLHSRLKH